MLGGTHKNRVALALAAIFALVVSMESRASAIVPDAPGLEANVAFDLEGANKWRKNGQELRWGVFGDLKSNARPGLLAETTSCSEQNSTSSGLLSPNSSVQTRGRRSTK